MTLDRQDESPAAYLTHAPTVPHLPEAQQLEWEITTATGFEAATGRDLGGHRSQNPGGKDGQGQPKRHAGDTPDQRVWSTVPARQTSGRLSLKSFRYRRRLRLNTRKYPASWGIS